MRPEKANHLKVFRHANLSWIISCHFHPQIHKIWGGLTALVFLHPGIRRDRHPNQNSQWEILHLNQKTGLGTGFKPEIIIKQEVFFKKVQTFPHALNRHCVSYQKPNPSMTLIPPSRRWSFLSPGHWEIHGTWREGWLVASESTSFWKIDMAGKCTKKQIYTPKNVAWIPKDCHV